MKIFTRKKSMNLKEFTINELQNQYKILAGMSEVIQKLRKEVIEMHDLTQKVPTIDQEKVIKHESRLQDLELWREKLHTMITDKTPRGKERINTIGKKFLRRD